MLRVGFVVVATLLVLAVPAQAATFTVTTATDGASCDAIMCSLRGAIAKAQQNGTGEQDTIIVPAGTYSTPEISVGSDAAQITIAGAGANVTTWRPSGATRVLALTGAGTFAIRDITLRGGRPAGGEGGNLLVTSTTLSLLRVRVTDGQAVAGGGLSATASSMPTAINITNSVFDHNVATGTANSDGGGAVKLQGQTFSAALTLTDSTLASNTATRGGALFGLFGNILTLRGVTVAANRSTFSSQTGGLQASSGATIEGSVIAGNLTPIAAGPGQVMVTANCMLGPVTDLGGNVSDTDCGFGSSSRTDTDPLVAATLDETQQPPTLAIPADSPAIDFAPCDPARTTDQRGQARPKGTGCDAGAFEFAPPAAPVTPTPSVTATAAVSSVADATPTPTPTPTATPAVVATAPLDSDRDGLADSGDRCPRLAGPALRVGCPTGLLADPSIRYYPTKRGIRVVAYYVKATKGARLEVSCSKGCKPTATTGRGAARVRITRLDDRALVKGTRITVTVTSPGRLTAIVVDRVAVGRRDEGRATCVAPGTTRPSLSC